MLNLVFVGSATEAALYGSIINRIDGARWVAYVSLDGIDGNDFSAGKNPLGVKIQEKSLQKLLQRHANEVDAIVIHAQTEPLGRLAKIATQAGKPTLAASLMARSVGECNALLAALGQGQELLVSPWIWRFIPAIQSVKASIVAGKLGAIGLIRMHRWNSETMAGNSDIRDRIIPAIDLAIWLFAAQPEKIAALKSSAVSDYMQMHLHFENQGMVLIDESGALPEGGDYFSLTVIGDKGAAYADEHRNMNLIVDGVYPHAIKTGQGTIHIAGQLQEFVDTVRNKQIPAVGQQEVLQMLQVSDAALEALTANKVSIWREGNYACY